MKVKSESEVAQSCLTPSDPMGFFQARVLEWGAIAFSVLYIAPLQKRNGNVPLGGTLGYGKLGVLPSCHLVSAQVIRDTLILKS